MKKLIAVLVLCMLAVPSFAGIGFHLNYDATTIDGEVSPQITFDGDVAGSGIALVRDEVSGLVGGGIDFTFGMIPMIDLMLSIEGAYGTYAVAYAGVGAAAAINEPVNEDIPYLRAGADLTALYTILPIPMVGGVYVGGGPSFMAVAPVFSKDLVLDNFQSAEEEVDAASLADDIQMEFGLHLTVGAKLKPVGWPIAFRVGAKYYIIPSLEDPAPGSWLTLQAGIVLGG
ncbi:MAG TPA: hypothetical protein ENH10_04680 [Bacteroidetes bacterium]|nr:hypothetical protein BMS3Bbin04_01051 [bacterium BMS3Bbin04]HDO65311.1 hypothetical protein [Bacteroidota bacterium]HEX04436.1 hypothetical protein [Bacteroidota bacterium]